MVAEGGKVLELLVFKLRADTSREALLGTVDAVSSWAAEQPGFVSRSLVEDREGGRWIDVVWWQSMEDLDAHVDGHQRFAGRPRANSTP